MAIGSVVIEGLVYGLSPQDDLKVYNRPLHAHTLLSDNYWNSIGSDYHIH